jgi:acetyltransferase-like isoleucine patch superfamily enzyme
MTSLALRQWVKRRDNFAALAVYSLAMWWRGASVPCIPSIHGALYLIHRAIGATGANLLRIVWTTPLFQSRLVRPAAGLFLYGGMPLVLGPVEIAIGPGCRISGQTTITGRTAGAANPTLAIGGNCDIGWQTTIAAGRQIRIGDNVRIAGRALLAGYPGHPLDARARAAGAADTDEQVGDIILEDDVWLATGVTVIAGVRIGRGTVVAAGSVVTRDLPAHVLAAGNPARVIRSIAENTIAE